MRRTRREDRTWALLCLVSLHARAHCAVAHWWWSAVLAIERRWRAWRAAVAPPLSLARSVAPPPAVRLCSLSRCKAAPLYISVRLCFSTWQPPATTPPTHPRAVRALEGQLNPPDEGGGVQPSVVTYTLPFAHRKGRHWEPPSPPPSVSQLRTKHKVCVEERWSQSTSTTPLYTMVRCRVLQLGCRPTHARGVGWVRV
jgi:hypothetical protein